MNRRTRSSSDSRSRSAAPRNCEALESRVLLSTTVAGVTTARGFDLATFANAPGEATQPDSIAVDGSSVFVGYQNGAAKDGSSGASTIVQYNAVGAIVRTFSVPGHNDGLKVDPTTHLVWALQNEDANPNLVIINPAAGTQAPFTFAAAPANGGGYDDITFIKGKTYFSESNPASNPNTAPAIVQATLNGSTVSVTPVLAGNASALNLVTRKQVTLNVQDPDSMTSDPAGDLVLTSQADNELVIVKNPGTAKQKASVLPLTDGSKAAVSVDDSLFAPATAGTVLVTDQKNNAVYEISGGALKKGLALSAAQDIGQVGILNVGSGRFSSVISGLGSPRGLAFLAAPAKGITVSTFAAAPEGASQSDSIAVDGSNVFVGFQNHVAKDGTDGKSSTIVQYGTAGNVLHTYSVVGHNDGLKVDPSSHLLWALQNEDANPNLVIINPSTGAQQNFTFATPADMGGYDDITFVGGKTFLSESNPAANPNTAPAIVLATLSGSSVAVTPVLAGNATAFNQVTHKKVTLNLQDPDSMTSDLAGNLILTSQADNELITVKHPGAANQSVTVIPLSDARKTADSVDDSLVVSSRNGTVLMTDLNTSTIYRITGSALTRGVLLSAAPDIGQLGMVRLDNGRFTSLVNGFGSPRGLAFLA